MNELRTRMREENLRLRRAYEALEEQGLVASKIERYPDRTVVVLRVPETQTFALAVLVHDGHRPGRVSAGHVRFTDPATGRETILDGTVRAEAWLRRAEATPVREIADGTTYLDWR